MRIATPSGGFAEVSRRSWPLSGLDYPARWNNGVSTIPLAGLPGGGFQSATYAQIYRSNPWVYAAIQARARGVSRSSLKVFQYDADGHRTRIRGDLPGGNGRPSSGQMLDRLLRSPEPGVGRAEWVRKVSSDRNVYGNALVYIERNSSTLVPTALFHVPWERVTLLAGDSVPVLGYEVSGVGGANRRLLAPDDVIHFGRGTDLNSPIGLSPLAPLKFTLALHEALWRHAVAYFANSARPSGMVKLQPNANETTIARIREQIERLYASPEAAGKILVTSGEWTSMTDSPSHSQIVELARLSREEIAAAFGIPQPMMGILDRAILNNVKELRNYFTRDTVGEEAASFEDDLMAQLVYPAFGSSGLFVEFDLSEMLRPDLEARADVFEKMRHVYTPDEMREMEGLTPLGIEASETVWMPSGQIGLGIEVEVEAPDPLPSDPESADSDPSDA